MNRTDRASDVSSGGILFLLWTIMTFVGGAMYGWERAHDEDIVDSYSLAGIPIDESR